MGFCVLMGKKMLIVPWRLCHGFFLPVIMTSAGDRNVGFFKKNGYLLRGELKDVPKGYNCCALCKMI